MRYPGAIWIGPTVNETPDGMGNVVGVALHIQEGYEAGSESWFKNPEAQASSHLLNPKSGQMRQLVDFKDKAWAEVAGNAHWISIENEGFQGDSLTDSQLQNIADFYKWAHSTWNIPFVKTDDVNTPGLGWHGMGGVAWGNHPNCPGNPIKAQRDEILKRATGGAGTPPVKPVVLIPWPGQYLSYNPDVYNSNVKLFQQRMLDREWTGIGSADGYFGSKTNTVVHQFQQEKGLQVDGIIGPDTWNTAFRTDNVT